MTAITDVSDYVNLATGGGSGAPENVFWWKTPYISGTIDTYATTGILYSMWRYDGFPGGGATPTTVTAPTSSTTGAMQFTDPGGGRQKWLMSATAAVVPGNLAYLMIYDRLLQIGGLSGTNTSPQTVGGSITRHTGGQGNQIWVEINTAVGGTARTITASYTNQSGTSSRTTTAVTFGGSTYQDANQIIQLPLQAGDTGVQAVASVTISATTGTAGDFGVLITHPVAFLPTDETGVAPRSFATGMPGLMEVESGACLAVLGYVVSTSPRAVYGALGYVEK